MEYFERTAYLAQSPQFYKQMAMAAGFGRVFEVGPVFRANPSFTSRHDTEFTSVDVEISWVDSHEDVMAFEEAWLAHVFGVVAAEHGEAIRETFGVEVVVPALPFPRIALAEAKELLRARGPRARPGRPATTSTRRASGRSAALVAQEHGHEFAFLTDYPTAVRPFYHMRHARSAGAHQELRSAVARHRDHHRRPARAPLRCCSSRRARSAWRREPIQYYLDFFRYGAPPHGGFGFGLTRLLMQMLGQENVREVTFLYRGPNRLEP